MNNSQALIQTLALLGGELRDSAGRVLTTASSPIVAVETEPAARAAFARGSRVAIAVPLTSDKAISRVATLLRARVRTRDARRLLARAGAAHVRAFAVVMAGESLSVAYEMGDSSQKYVEGSILFKSPAAAPVRLARHVMRRLGGVPTNVDLVVVVGAAA